MAMSTTFYAVPTRTIEALRADHAVLDSLGEDAHATFDTYLVTGLEYALMGDGDDDEGSDADGLGQALSGAESVDCDRLENSAFHLLPAQAVAELAPRLALVDPAVVESQLLLADLEDAYDGEVSEEAEMLDLFEPEAIAAALGKDMAGLIAFYTEAAQAGLAVVFYTS